jgi:hypothetical protein
MIVSIRDKRTREFAEGNRVKAFSGFERQAEMKLDELESATSLLDLDQCFRKTLKKEPLYSLPLEGATPGGGDYLFCYLKMLSPSPQPPPLKGGGGLGPRDIKDISETRH